METQFEHSAVNETKSNLFPIDHAARTAAHLLTDVMRFRRLAGAHESCGAVPCSACLAPHLRKVASAIAQRKPVTFVLPAFPGKSPNPNKVLGLLPDMAEQRALEFLGHLCERIRKYHAPGARIILCSDGRVFSDVVGMREDDVTAYQREISRMIATLGLTSVSTFNLDDSCSGQDFSKMRRELMEEYGKPLDVLKTMVRDGGNRIGGRENEDAHHLYCGITRFLVEDAHHPGQTRSRTSIQKECRVRAYEVIQRSNAWSELIAHRFPDAVRLSIHPQTCGSNKLGIRLVANENWMTPWHGVAVDVGGRFLLLKRSQAEALGARMVHSAGRPSHFELTAVQPLAKAIGE
jgi:pyoverdine/dityrosine biosynthesis protein Dit1